MHVISYIALLIFISITSVISYKSDNCDVYLSRSDFNKGTYRITNSGTYCLNEDITFNPVPGSSCNPNDRGAWFPADDILYPGSITQKQGPFSLGFFAAITIETSDVTIDLSGYTLQFGHAFYLQQRWGSIIEIANQAFLPGVGPADWGDNFIHIDNVEIRNGKLGLTSHHAIHSNGATNVVIKNLQITHFEVAAVQLNGFNGAIIENIQIGPSLDRVPLTVYYSNAKFLLLALRHVLADINDNALSMPSITFYGGRTLSLQQIEENLVEAMNLVFGVLTGTVQKEDVKYNPLYQAGAKLFMNEAQLPDGSALYGIVLNSKSAAVNGFGQSSNMNKADGYNAMIKNVNIENLKINANEIPALYFDKCTNQMSDSKTIQTGPFGDVFDLRKVIHPNDVYLIEKHEGNPSSLSDIKYIGNVLSDAQIALVIYGGNNKFGGFIADELIAWAKGESLFPSECADFICNGDIMFHVNKGLSGLRLDGIEEVTITDVTINNLQNRSPLVSCACGPYEGPQDGGIPGTSEGEGGMSTDVRGIVITHGDANIIGSNNKIIELESYYGDTTGIDLMGSAELEFEVSSDVTIENLKSASKLNQKEYDALVDQGKTPYPNNFDLCIINIQDEAVVVGDVPHSLDSTDCIERTDFDNKIVAEHNNHKDNNNNNNNSNKRQKRLKHKTLLFLN